MYFILGLREIYNGKVAQNLLINKSVNCWIIKNSNTVKKILFPMEGRSWEQGIVDLMTKNRLESIGYIHCVVTPKHLSLLSSGFYKPNEIPKIIIEPSQMIRRLVQKTFTNSLIRKGYFLRGGGNRKLKHLKSNDVLLFALTGDVKECKNIINFILNTGIQKSHKVRVSLNPNASSYLYLVKYVKKIGIGLYLHNQESRPAVCFFRSSSVALDYLCINVPPIYLSLGEIVNGNVFDLDDTYKCEVLNISPDFLLDFSRILNEIKSALTCTESQKISSYYLDQKYNNSKLKQLIN